MRNLSAQEMFIRMAESHRPKFHFEGFKGGFQRWKKSAKPAVLATLGQWPESVPANPELVAEWMDRGLRKRRYLIDVGPHASVAFQVNVPGNLRPGEKRPAILCWHGHGPAGKDGVMGNLVNDDVRAEIRRHNYDYGHQMAEKGFVTFAIDWMGGGERSEIRSPHFRSTAGGRDWCNLYYLHATQFGMTSLSINLGHARAATDFALTLPEIDARRLGVMGLSGGGTMTLWTALCDRRFKAAEIICYSHLWALFGIRAVNYCGMQVAPGLYTLVDVPDLQGLLAPLPLLVDIGSADDCFPVGGAMACHRQLKKIYAAAGAADRLQLDLFPGGHVWGGHRSEAFFKKELGF